MIVGASLGSFKGLTLEQSMELYIKLTNDFALGAVEIRFGKEEGRPSLWPGDENERLAGFLSNFKVAGAHLPFAGLNPVSPNPEIKKESLGQLKMALDKASQLNMNYAVMHARGYTRGLTRAQQLNEWEAVLKELADYAASRSILLAIENGDFLGNLKELLGVVRRIDSKWLKVMLDVGHAYNRRIRKTNRNGHLFPYPLDGMVLKALDMTLDTFIFKKYLPFEEYGSINGFLQAENDLIFGLHLHDNNGRTDHISLGSGRIDFSFLPMLDKPDSPLILEVAFSNHYPDFRRNYTKLMELVEKK